MSGSSCIELSDKLKFKTYADFEFVLKEVQINDNDNNAPYTESIRNICLAYKVVLLTIDLQN